MYFIELYFQRVLTFLEFCIRGLLTEELSNKVMLDYSVFMSSVCPSLATKAISQICEETFVG